MYSTNLGIEAHTLNIVVICREEFILIDNGCSTTIRLKHNSPKKALEVADEPVDIAFSGRFVDDILVVIVPETSAELLVVHFWLILPVTPSSGHL